MDWSPKPCGLKVFLSLTYLVFFMGFFHPFGKAFPRDLSGAEGHWETTRRQEVYVGEIDKGVSKAGGTV